MITWAVFNVRVDMINITSLTFAKLLSRRAASCSSFLAPLIWEDQCTRRLKHHLSSFLLPSGGVLMARLTGQQTDRPRVHTELNWHFGQISWLRLKTKNGVMCKLTGWWPLLSFWSNKWRNQDQIFYSLLKALISILPSQIQATFLSWFKMKV